ncbi:MAG: DUF3794 domain-containing protein [Oscillospiraceae bacterium]|nr:DUF3794 domain-containing protein [Oscillospiraceae bacterium]
MEINFETEKFRYYSRLYCSDVVHEETSEMIVPDTMPDVRSVADSDGMVFMRSKEAQNGRFLISGVTELFVLYEPEGESGLRRLSLQAPFSFSCACPGLTTLGRISAAVRLSGVEVRMINSRKLLLRCELYVSAAAYLPQEIKYIPYSENADRTLELLKSEYELFPVTDVTEKTFGISETSQLPASKPPLGQIIKTRVRFAEEESECIGSRLIVKGSAYVAAVYTSSDSGEIHSTEFRTPFSVMIETDGECDGAEFDSMIMLTGCSVTANESGELAAEIAGVVQTTVCSRKRIVCVSDAYSVNYNADTVIEKVPVEKNGACEKCGETLRLTAEHAKSIKSVIDCRGGISRPREENGSFRAEASVRIICADESGKLTVLSAGKEWKGPAGSYALETGEIYVTQSPEGAEARIPLSYLRPSSEKTELTILTGAELDEEKRRSRDGVPSVTVFRAAEGDSIWSLGKRFGTSPDEIRAANGMESGGEIKPGQLILISKQR